MGRRISKEFLHPSILEGVNDKIGDLDSLETDAKGNMVQAINELADKIDTEIAEGKELIANAVGEPLTAEESFDEMSNDINSLLSTFKTNMMNNGITVESNDKFKSLIDKIATMVEEGSGKGMRYASGEISIPELGSSSTESKRINQTINITLPIDFTPSIFIIDNYQYKTGYYASETWYRHEYTFILSNILPVYGATKPNLTITINNNVISINTNHYISSEYSYCPEGTYTYHAIGVGEEDTTLRDSLASILEEEGVNITEEDDMASLITKVDEEFNRQVVPAGTAVASNVLSGKTFINSTGQTITGTMANRGGAQTVTPGTSNKTLNSGYYSGNITVKGDSNLKAENIVSGKTIFGVSGSASASCTKLSCSESVSVPNTCSNQTAVITHGLGFKPNVIICVLDIDSYNGWAYNTNIPVFSNIHTSSSSSLRIAATPDDLYSSLDPIYGLRLYFWITNITTTTFTLNYIYWTNVDFEDALGLTFNIKNLYYI